MSALRLRIVVWSTKKLNTWKALSGLAEESLGRWNVYAKRSISWQGNSPKGSSKTEPWNQQPHLAALQELELISLRPIGILHGFWRLLRKPQWTYMRVLLQCLKVLCSTWKRHRASLAPSNWIKWKIQVHLSHNNIPHFQGPVSLKRQIQLWSRERTQLTPIMMIVKTKPLKSIWLFPLCPQLQPCIIKLSLPCQTIIKFLRDLLLTSCRDQGKIFNQPRFNSPTSKTYCSRQVSALWEAVPHICGNRYNWSEVPAKREWASSICSKVLI